MRTFPPNTVIVEVDPLPGEEGYDWAGPIFSWARGFLVGAVLFAATVADMPGSGLNAIRL